MLEISAFTQRQSVNSIGIHDPDRDVSLIQMIGTVNFDSISRTFFFGISLVAY